ncbi:hypothetical protein H4R35_003421 [Dimargaris xerosporica]|nr:hypothetical protein H4R35_003421 [Dimargaris xerosporica]
MAGTTCSPGFPSGPVNMDKVVTPPKATGLKPAPVISDDFSYASAFDAVVKPPK